MIGGFNSEARRGCFSPATFGGYYAEADKAMITAAETATNNNRKWIESTSNFYHAMSLFQQGKPDEAHTLFIEAEAKMKPLPADEKNPLADDANHDDLILWLAYKEAKGLLAETGTDEDVESSE
ncbi:MAG: hypothetical protein ACKVH8_19455 [Pirellulales bacterium]|jgi:hypothetical protein